jgi:hypothetical protein
MPVPSHLNQAWFWNIDHEMTMAVISQCPKDHKFGSDIHNLMLIPSFDRYWRGCDVGTRSI